MTSKGVRGFIPSRHQLSVTSPPARAAAGGIPGTVRWGRSASLFGKVTGSLPEGSTLPKMMLAMASPPRIPGNQASRAALTLPNQGMVTGPPVSSTTMQCGLAAATWLTSRS